MSDLNRLINQKILNIITVEYYYNVFVWNKNKAINKNSIVYNIYQYLYDFKSEKKLSLKHNIELINLMKLMNHIHVALNYYLYG